MGFDVQAISDALLKIIALIFVNLVPFFLDPAFLAVAVSIDSLVLGISVQSLLNKNTERRLDLTLSEILHLAKIVLGVVEKSPPREKTHVETAPKQVIKR
ncbi:hypothetical protein J7K74_03730 [Candidatus Woesearchaeota archaeon]|nr:hypothetical protein [Candidatus Woesearchaeota archaeon]